MRTTKRSLNVITGAVFLVCCVANAQTYRVASTSDGFGSIYTAVINNSGTVAFYGERTSTSGERFRGIYKGKTGVTTLMEDSLDNPPAAGQFQLVSPGQGGDYISINGGGKVGCWGWKGAGSKPLVYVSAAAIMRANFLWMETDRCPRRSRSPTTAFLLTTGMFAVRRRATLPTPSSVSTL